MIKAVFFDFDGTIADTRGAFFKAFVRTFDDFESEIDKIKVVKNMGTELFVLFKKMGINPGHIDAMRRRFYKHYGLFTKEKIKSCVSLKPLFKISEDYKLFIISNSETFVIKKLLKSLEIKSIFSGIYGSDKFSTKDKMIRKIYRKINVKPSEVIYVGDRFTDIEYSRSAGCVSVAIHNKCSWSDLKTIKAQRPDYIIKDFRELGRLLKILKKNG
ncbi:MAG: HAD family hydrolase [Nanoarchaeota archaeon]|nr:HAD family hydrolase [Nanoarchaeota archaeon]